MIISSATFVKSSPGLKDCPDPGIPEYAFIGRSNVGKSSLLNMLVGRKSLAKTSGKPGKTRLINFFLINEQWYLVDLPGYGYAAVSKTERASWIKMIRGYLQRRVNLMTVFLLVDCRIEPQLSDLEYISWMGQAQIPFVIVFTKTDKLTPSKLDKAVKDYQNRLYKDWVELPPMILSSATNKRGQDEILDYISETNKLFDPRSFKLHK